MQLDSKLTLEGVITMVKNKKLVRCQQYSVCKDIKKEYSVEKLCEVDKLYGEGGGLFFLW